MSSSIKANTNSLSIGPIVEPSNQVRKKIPTPASLVGISPPKLNPGPSSFVQKQNFAPLTKTDNGLKSFNQGKKLADQKKERLTSNRQLALLQENIDEEKAPDPKKKMAKVRNSILITNPKKQLKDLNLPNAFDQLIIRRDTIKSRAVKQVEKSSDMIDNIFSKDGLVPNKLKSKQNIHLLQNTSNYTETKESEKKKDSSKLLSKGELINKYKANSQTAKAKPKGCFSFLSCFISK